MRVSRAQYVFKFVGDTDSVKGLAEKSFEEEAGKPYHTVVPRRTLGLRAQQGRTDRVIPKAWTPGVCF